MACQPAECNIKVVVRIHPLNKKEGENGSKIVVKTTDHTVTVEDKTFNFDYVFEPMTQQQSVYDKVAKPLVSNVLSGYNATIFAYGQTSGGKTYTMEGMVGDPIYQGIIPRVVDDLFGQISQADASIRFCVKVSYYEIYMEKIRDLLDPTRDGLKIRQDRNRVPYVKGCTERTVSTPDEMMAAIEDGRTTRTLACTNMNERSSRSHSLFVIKITQENATTNKKLIGKLSLVDLAGSEKVSKTGAAGVQLSEAKFINKSLSALGKVIHALSKRDAFIPYRESKLTRILQESIGGNSKTAIILCCSPASYNQEETKSTLYFGASAKTIKNLVKVNEELTMDELKRLLEKERATVRRQDRIIESIAQELRKWRNGTYAPRTDWVDLDTLAINGIGAARTKPDAVPSISPDISAATSLEDLSDDVENFDDQPERTDAMEVEATLIEEKAVLLEKLAEAQCRIDKYKSRFECAREQLNIVITNLEATNLIDALCDIRTKLDGLSKDSVVGDGVDLDNVDKDSMAKVTQLCDKMERLEELLAQLERKDQEKKARKEELSKNVVPGRRGRRFFQHPAGATAYPVDPDGDHSKDRQNVTSDEQLELSCSNSTGADGSVMTIASRNRKQLERFGDLLDSTVVIVDRAHQSFNDAKAQISVERQQTVAMINTAREQFTGTFRAERLRAVVQELNRKLVEATAVINSIPRK